MARARIADDVPPVAPRFSPAGSTALPRLRRGRRHSTPIAAWRLAMASCGTEYRCRACAHCPGSRARQGEQGAAARLPPLASLAAFGAAGRSRSATDSLLRPIGSKESRRRRRSRLRRRRERSECSEEHPRQGVAPTVQKTERGQSPAGDDWALRSAHQSRHTTACSSTPGGAATGIRRTRELDP